MEKDRASHPRPLDILTEYPRLYYPAKKLNFRTKTKAVQLFSANDNIKAILLLKHEIQGMLQLVIIRILKSYVASCNARLRQVRWGAAWVR